ncbi:DUF6705 family protein [Chryseobacterium salviniae]|uniref:DUF6705 family protein n=1 Tax=Chryseobacterium salviniae TaxID=3101750 RepID=A0ABU6HRX4_9FLAO|nr:DUF6705 family protein [Chryseobacterium sp. T9W2-O]MEC3875792.1 DUF6705 family protein [Chryseobacterium sp. T9W2-O]
MKKIFLSTIIFLSVQCKAQIYSLRTYGIEFPQNSYVKDTNNELPAYEGIWKGIWNNKTIFVTFKKITNEYDKDFEYYRDFLIAKFKVINSNGLVLFDNTLLPDSKAKILGGRFRKTDNKYSLIYIDPDLCSMSGNIYINFTDATQTKLNWKAVYGWDLLTESCPYYDSPTFPEPLPYEIILIKQ